MSAPCLVVKNLSKIVSDMAERLVILHDISFTLEFGKSLAITGVSGSGKSTLLGLLAGLDVPSSGEVWLDGQSLFVLNEDERALWRKARVGFVFQSFQLLPDLTALENVALALELDQQPDARIRAQALLEEIGLGERLMHLPKYLSGGEQQRVALARAFVTRPKILFADEPTGNLDFATSEKIVQLMFTLQKSYATTVVLITHDRELAKRCDCEIIIDKGQIIHTRGQNTLERT